MAELAGRVALVTGAAQGLGRAIAARLHAEGARVALADIQADKVAATARVIDPPAQGVLALAVDVVDAAAVAGMVDQAVERFGRLDILVNTAGGSGHVVIDTIDAMTDEAWDGIIARNLRGSFLCCRAAAPYLRRAGAQGRILNFSSGAVQGVSDKTTIFAPLAYASAKAALHGLTNQLAKDLAPAGVTVNVLQPGFVLTEPGARVREHFDAMSEDQRADMLRRLKAPPRQPAEVGWAVAYLASDRARGITGTTVRLAGQITGLNQRLVAEGTSPFGPYARLEPAD